MGNVNISSHPLLEERISQLRDVGCPCERFQTALEEIGTILFVEASSTLDTNRVDILTPLEKTVGKIIAKPIVLVPVLRAGLGLMNGIRKLVPNAVVGMIGLRRDEETLKAEEYLNKLPKNIKSSTVFLLDPMLATGGSAISAIEMLIQAGACDISLLSVIASPEGLDKVSKKFPNIRIYVGALDRELNENGYILPGLGDAGDRYFGV